MLRPAAGPIDTFARCQAGKPRRKTSNGPCGTFGDPETLQIELLRADLSLRISHRKTRKIHEKTSFLGSRGSGGHFYCKYDEKNRRKAP